MKRVNFAVFICRRSIERDKHIIVTSAFCERTNLEGEIEVIPPFLSDGCRQILFPRDFSSSGD